jgi:phosphopantetheinyl transferase (holo-ACP synthase)
MIVGNDVVDLTAPRAVGRSRDERFVARVFTELERAALLSADDPDGALWLAWAAKEAAYKVVSKIRGTPPVFVHRAFEVVWAPGSREGVVRYEGDAIPVVAEPDPAGGYLHVLAHAPDDSGRELRRTVERLDPPDSGRAEPLDALLERLTERERDAVHSVPSAAVRIGARAELAALLGLEVTRLEIVCRPGASGRRPPYVLVDGSPAKVDVSLSHDGPWIAWALSTPRPHR